MHVSGCWVRVLFPFRWSCDSAPTFNELCASITQGNAIWLSHPEGDPNAKLAHSDYFTEYLPHVADFLFNAAGASGCHYLQVNSANIPASLQVDGPIWLRQLEPDETTAAEFRLPGKPTPRGLSLLGASTNKRLWIERPPSSRGAELDAAALPLQVSIQPDTNVELWLAKAGAGVLSLSLQCQPVEQGGSDPFRFIECVGQLTHSLATAQKAVYFRTADSEPQWRHVHQWICDLLRPLREQVKLEFDQRGVVCSVLEVNDSNFASNQLDSCLSHLAQIHPFSHPGESVSAASVLEIHQGHRCALSLNGAAHAVLVPAADASQYDRLRMRRVQLQYFPGYLVAHIQRLCLQRFMDDSAIASGLKGESLRLAHQQLLTKVLRFCMEGEFVQACWRDTLQRHHEVSQRVCLIHEGLQTVRSAMSDFAAVSNELARQEREREAHQSERTMQVLEVFIVTIYSVELAHTLGDGFDFHTKPFVGWSLLAVGVLSFAMASLLVSWKWLQRKGALWTIIGLFVMSSLIHVGFLGANAWWKTWSTHTLMVQPDGTASPEPKSEDPDSHHL